MNITVYLGANAGNEEIFSEAVCELGSWIGRSKNRLVYGGSKTGLMGRLAESVLRSQGEVIGVEAQFFMEQNVQMEDLTQLIVTKDITCLLYTSRCVQETGTVRPDIQQQLLLHNLQNQSLLQK